jgi:hypothetical protein
MPDLWRVSAGLVILFFALFSLLIFYMIDRARMQRKDKLAQQ